jgi:hypothetical protein
LILVDKFNGEQTPGPAKVAGPFFFSKILFALKMQKYLLHKICLLEKHHYIFATQKQNNATL